MQKNDRFVPRPDFSQVQADPPPPEPEKLADATSPLRAKPDFSNVQSGGSSTAKVLNAEKAERLYTVKAGDNLSRIAKHEYGDAMLWKRIFEANRDIIKNPDLIYPGQVIKLPSIVKARNA